MSGERVKSFINTWKIPLLLIAGILIFFALPRDSDLIKIAKSVGAQVPGRTWGRIFIYLVSAIAILDGLGRGLKWSKKRRERKKGGEVVERRRQD